MREAEKKAQAGMVEQYGDDETPEEIAFDEIRRRLHDSIQSAAEALALLNELEARSS